jgi:hypothetical protein
VTERLGRLLLDTLRLVPGDADALRRRWTAPDVLARAAAIATWSAWEGTALWLRRRLADLDVLPRLPGALAEPLRRAGLRAAQAHLAIDAETEQVVRLLGAHEIACLLIKGPARRVVAPPALSDTRGTSDVDLLIPATEAARAWSLLRAAGYAPLAPHPGAPPPRTEMWGESQHHLRPLVRPGGVAVELHVSTSWELPPAVAWERLSATARAYPWRGLTVRCPSGTELLWHALTHAQIADPVAWRLRFWLDAATAMAVEPPDWDVIAVRLGGPESPGPTAALWLDAAAALAGVVLPPAIAPRRYPLERMLTWRVSVYGRRALGRALREKLIDEATRAEAGIGLAPAVAGRGVTLHARRRLATIAARLGYALWRAASR